MQSTKQSRGWSRRLVAGVLLVGLASLAQLANAQDAHSVLESRTPLGSINFITNEGQIVSYSTFGGNWLDHGRFNAAGTQTSKAGTTTYTGTQTIGYGVTNNIEISLRDSYSSASSKVSPVNASSYSERSYGFEDPSFSIIWRAVNQGRANPFNLDLTATYSPDLLDAKGASATFDGTSARGGAVFNGTAAISHASNGNIYYLSFSSINGLERNVLIQPGTGAYNQKLDEYLQYYVEVAYQHYFNERFSATAGFNYYSSESYLVTNQGGNNLVYNRNQGPQYRPNITLNYAFVPNQVVGSLGYTHIFASNTDNTVSPAPKNSFSVRDEQGDLVNATLRILLH